MYIDPDDGKSVKQLATGRTTEELKARSHAASVRSSEEDNAYRIDGIHSAIDEYDFMIQVLDLGLEDIVYLYSASRWLVMGKYWYFNRTGKWSRVEKVRLTTTNLRTSKISFLGTCQTIGIISGGSGRKWYE